MRKTTWMLVGLITLASAHARAADDGAGLTPNGEPWARWQGRLSFGTSAPTWHPGLADSNAAAPKLNRISLMGDYYLTSSSVDRGNVGGWRATSGVILGPRGQLWAGQASTNGGTFSVDTRPFGPGAAPYANDAVGDTATLPYLGLGYTGLSLRGGWSFTADFGLVAQSPGNALRLGRTLGSGQSLDDAVRELHISPLLQVGVSYMF